MCATDRGPGDKSQRHLIVGTQEQKDTFIDVARNDITMLHLCQTTKQADD